MRTHWMMVGVLALAVTATAHAQWGRGQLKVGDEAPILDIEQWILGEEISQLEPGTVYMVEFWATWCGPCRRAIPFLSRLQESYGDDGLVIIGISDEKPEDVRRFVQRNPGAISYRIAVDKNDATKRAWMQAAGQQGIPTSFIVDANGRIQYIGHPQGDHIETILQLVLQGRYDQKLFQEVVPAIEAKDSAVSLRNWRLAHTHLDQIIDHDKHVFAMFNIEKFKLMVADMNEPERAYKFAREVIEEYALRADAHFLASFAEHIATEPAIPEERRDLSVAMMAAQAAAATARANDPRVLSVLALVNFQKGNVDEAISLQRRAWMIAPPPRKPPLERTLRVYQDSQQRASRAGTGQPTAGKGDD